MTIQEFNLTDIAKITKKLARSIKPGDVIALYGPLAAGKTTLTAALMNGLGYDGQVSSPTFVLERRYPIKRSKIKEVVHLDFYRLSEDQIGSLDWLDTVNEPGTVTIIEWPERVEPLLPARTKRLTLEIINGQTRRLTLSDNFAD